MKTIKLTKPLLATLLLAFVLGMLLFSSYTSPLYPSYYGADSALFTLIGKGITEGKTVYKDLFDHKGPVLFFIEAFGYLIGKSTGIFILQCIFGIVNLLLLYRVWTEINKEGTKSFMDLLVVFLAGCAVLFYTFQFGNLSEEYSLPLISASLLLFVKYAKACESNARHPYKYSFAYGIIITLLFFIRLNNAITVLAGVFAIILYLFFKKEYKNILGNILFGVLGMCVAALPFILYFTAKSALYDMLYATFLYNFKYAGNVSHQSIILNFFKYAVLYSPIILSVILLSLKIKKNGNFRFLDFITVIIVAFNALCLIISNVYPHYFTIFVPVFVLVLSGYFKLEKKIVPILLLTFCVAAHALIAGYGFAKVVYANYYLRYPQKIHNNISAIVETIPEEERDSVIGFEISSDYYLYADIVPDFKYYTHQEWWSKSDPSVMESFVNHIESGNSLWVLTLPEEDNEQILEVLSIKYDLVKETQYFNMYKVKEGK